MFHSPVLPNVSPTCHPSNWAARWFAASTALPRGDPAWRCVAIRRNGMRRCTKARLGSTVRASEMLGACVGRAMSRLKDGWTLVMDM